VADEQDNPADLRIPISMTIPWRRAPNGQLWPLDRQGRYWPEDRRGEPQRPLDEFPPGFPAPGTGKRPMTIEEAAHSYLAMLDAEKAAYAEYGSKGIPTVTVTRGGNGQATAHPAPGHRAGAGAMHGHDAAAARAARLGPMMLIVGGTVVAVGEAPAILAALTALGLAMAFTEIILEGRGERRRFADRGTAAAFVRGTLGLSEEHEALVPPPRTPVLPPAPPPPLTEDKPGLVPPAPTPAQPGFTPAPPIPLTPPAAPPHPPVGMVVESSNRGLEGGARAHSSRARAAARRVDPEVVRHLEGAEWEAHHLINIAGIRRAKDLIHAAVRAGWRTDGEGNTAAVPHSADAQRKLQAAGVRRPVHNNGHSKWNEYVREELDGIRKKLNGKKFESRQEEDEALRTNWTN
jgi:hypothetical protein